MRFWNGWMALWKTVSPLNEMHEMNEVTEKIVMNEVTEKIVMNETNETQVSLR